jgi:hypothetical protein
MSKVFMSYSHKDEALRDELEIHLALLKRQGLISTWHDRKISPGDEFGNEIDINLEDSDIILLLVSPYFLASDYCYDIEMKRALERHENGESRVIPIILEHCDWHPAPFGRLLALPKDGNPVREYPNQNKAFSEIAIKLRKLIVKVQGKKAGSNNIKTNVESHNISTDVLNDPLRSSNLRVKKPFTDKEKDDYLKESFEYIFRFFKNSLNELDERNQFVDTNIERVDSQTFITKLYKEEEFVNQCKIWRGASFGSSETIKYSNSLRNENSYNMSFSVQNDGYTQYLETSGLLFDENEKLSQKGAAEKMWAVLIEPLQK